MKVGLVWLGRLVRRRGVLRVPVVAVLLLLLVGVLAVYAFLRVAFRSEAGMSDGATLASELVALWWPVATVVGLLAGAEGQADREAFGRE